MSLQYLKKEVKIKLIFLPVEDKNKIFLQDDSIAYVVHNQAYPKYSK